MNKTTVTQQASTSTFIPSSGNILQRKCACGNHTMAGGECTECAKKKMGLQRKLTIGASNDPLELEADRVSDQVMAASTNGAVSNAPIRIQRYTGQLASEGDTAPASVDRVLASSGRPLEPALRQDMEARFGHDFSQVRVHTDSEAAKSAQDLDANAYTVENHISFASGQFSAETNRGKRLIAHELSHVLQQTASENRLLSSPLVIQCQHTRDRTRSTGGANPAPRRTLGRCVPVHDDVRPRAPWATLQADYQRRCGRAMRTAEDSVTRTARNIWDDLSHGRMPRMNPAGPMPNPRDSVDCICATFGPEAAFVAMLRVMTAGPLAAQVYAHFLGNTGTELNIDVADMIRRSSNVRAKILRSIRASHGREGTLRLEQSDYGIEDFQFAYGAIDCAQWQVASSAPSRWRLDPTTRVTISMLDYYEFHPHRTAASQCAHAAAVELVAQGRARNFWTSGSAEVSLADLTP